MTDKKTYIEFERLEKFAQSDAFKTLDKNLSDYTKTLENVSKHPSITNQIEAARDALIMIQKIKMLTNNEHTKAIIIDKNTLPNLEIPVTLSIKDSIDKLNNPHLDTTELPLNHGRNILFASDAVSDAILQASLKEYFKIFGDNQNLMLGIEKTLDTPLNPEINTSRRPSWAKISRAREYHRSYKAENIDPKKPLAKVLSLTDRIRKNKDSDIER